MTTNHIEKLDETLIRKSKEQAGASSNVAIKHGLPTSEREHQRRIDFNLGSENLSDGCNEESGTVLVSARN
jgi:hypothetical protein